MAQWGNSERRCVQTMSNADLIVSGSIHQADHRFSDLSRGRQCAFISFSALLPASSCRVSQWTGAHNLQVEFAGEICRSNLHVKFVG